MKHLKMIWAIFIVPLLFLATIVSSDDSQNRQTLQTIVIDDFDQVDGWIVKYSRFRSPIFFDDPKIPLTKEGEEKSDRVYYEKPAARENNREWFGWFTESNFDGKKILPDGLPGRASKEAKESQIEQKILGIRGRFDFPGYNWIVIEPNATRSAREFWQNARDAAYLDQLDSKPGDVRKDLLPRYVQLRGKTQALDFWVWGANYNYDMEIHLEDYLGVVHTLPAGNLNFSGWRNLRVNIPSYIMQEQPHTPKIQPLKFIRFKIVANPNERDNNFFIYMDYMQCMTDLYEETYFGKDLEWVNENWSQNKEENANNGGTQPPTGTTSTTPNN